MANRLDLSALEVAELYRPRWQIETLFQVDQAKPENQSVLWHLEECGAVQICTALIAYLLLVWLQLKSKMGWGPLECTRLAQTILLERLDWWELLGLRPPDNRQPGLFNQRAGHQC